MKNKLLCLLSALLVGVILIAFLFPANAAIENDLNNESEPSLRIRAFDSASTFVTLHQNEEGEYDLFLPAGCDRSRLFVEFSEPSLTINGVSLRDKKTTDAFKMNGKATLKTPKQIYSLNIYSSESLPSIFINTNSGSLSGIHENKSNKEPGDITLIENGIASLDAAKLEHIKGRGNSSWVYNEKRSYNIKLDQKIGLLGMQPAKKWALISNNMDSSLLRNAVVYSAAKCTRLPYTVSCAYVDLFINGDYRGNYLVCEKIEVSKNRIDIADLDEENEKANPTLKVSDAQRKTDVLGERRCAWFDIPKSPTDISGGYLLEYDVPEAFDTEQNSAFITKRKGNCLTLHSPDYATKKEIEYISELYEEFEDAVAAKNGKNKVGKHYTEYIDVDSFVDALLLKECTGNVDIGQTSWYIFLSEQTKLFYMGPVWDFDLSMFEADALPDCIRFYGISLHEKKAGAKSKEGKTFFELLCSHKDFINKTKNRFFEFSGELFDALTNAAENYKGEIAASAAMDAARWGYKYSASEGAGLIDYFGNRESALKRDFLQLKEKANEVSKNAGTKDEIHESRTFAPLIIVSFAAVCLAIVLASIMVRRNKRKHLLNKKRKENKKANH